ncbi:MAG: aminopeptidase [Oscillospiraceae bacterium]|nr:aminopeptidase [Oscillospiraceae bacterium]
MAEKKNAKKNEALREKLLYAPKNGYDTISEKELAEMEEYCKGYKLFLDNGKTERMCVEYCIELATARGFKPYERGMKLKAGDKIYVNNRDKGIMLAVIGTQPLDKGANIGAAHTDAPRLDLKPRPLYEDSEIAYFKTHHYGGIRKYQWVTVPLELHGVAVLRDGTVQKISVGRDEGDPQFIINDLLPHLGREQNKKPLGEAIPSENLNVLVGSRPFADDEGKDRVKLSVLDHLNKTYGISEEDLISAEIEMVPAGTARDIGFDRSLIAAYGHDDRVCAYAELAALFAVEKPEKTAVCIFADKEEIGSEGVSGMQSGAFDAFMEDLCESQGVALRACYANSFCLSADVTAAYDPNFAEVYEKRNSAYINYGVGVCKYTGAGGKSGASDASAEVVGKLRKALNDNGVAWQMAELGKTDAGGGGTVAMFMAKRNIDTIDAGVPVLSMHAPYETVAKYDCYMTYRAMKAIFRMK